MMRKKRKRWKDREPLGHVKRHERRRMAAPRKNEEKMAKEEDLISIDG